MDSDLQFVDDYLGDLDRFAQGENELFPLLRRFEATFEAALARLLWAQDKRAPARMVFYPVVQVGGSIPVDSDLGTACEDVLGADFTVTTTSSGQRVYFGGHLYLWWEANRGRFDAYPLFDEWAQRDFAKTMVIPMLKSSASDG